MYGAKGESLGPATHYYRKSGGAEAVGGHQAMEGRAEITLERISEDRFRIDYRQQAPLKIFLPRIDSGAAAEVVLANSAGGIAGGDHLTVRVAMGADTAAVVTSQAAEKAYRSRGPAADLETRVTVGPRARLAWVPQETILFDGARLCRRLDFDLDGTARLLAGEMWVFGRIARGEVFGHGLLHDIWHIRRDGRLVWADSLRLDGDIRRPLDATAGFAGARAAAALVLAGPDAAGLLEPVRRIIDRAPCRAGATVVGGVLVARWLGPDPAEVRAGYGECVAALMQQADPARSGLPVVWHV